MLQPHKTPQKLVTIDSTAITFAMLGIVLTSFMIGVVMTPPFHSGGWPDIPRVAHPVAMYRAERADAMRIVIATDGQLYLGNELTDEIHVAQDLETSLNLGAERKIYVSADARAR